jgi:CHAT domain-containing protein
VIKGEGMVGLTRAFLYAGSPSIVVSLWTVADDSTSRLMIHFYNYLKEGYSRSEALRQAKLTLLKEEIDGDILYNDPFYWGPFILNGLNS